LNLFSISERDRLRAIAIGTVVLLSYAYFYKGNSGDWNQNARFDLTRAIVEQHTLRIDAYHRNTASKAFWQDHYYSDKAPGLSLAAVPVWASIHAAVVLANLPGRDSTEGRAIRVKTYLSTFVVVALPTALAATCIFLLALMFGVSPAGSVFGALTFGLGTPMWSYAVLFRSQAAVAALLLFAFAAAIAVQGVHSLRRHFLLGAAVGLAAGWATVTEYPAAPAAVILALLVVAHAWRSRRNVQHVLAGVSAGALVCVVILMSYQYRAFGSPFRIGYSFTLFNVAPPAPEMGNGLFGITYPRLWIVRELLVGRYRGLLPLSPVLALAPIGFVQLWRRRQESRVSILAAAALIVYYVMLNASYKYWDGGYSTGPRHLAPLLPFLSLGLGLVWTWSRPVHRILLVILALYGIVIGLMATSTDPMPGTDVASPIQELFWPAFRTGHLGTFNLGEFFGLRGLPSLLPLGLIWILGLTGWLYLERRMKGRKLPVKTGAGKAKNYG
jgi:hypothetical protein